MTITEQKIDQTIDQLKDIFGRSASDVKLFNDLPKYCIYAINTHYSIGKNTLKQLRKIKGKLTFIDFDNKGLRLLVEIKNV
jgi:hypothetical protein